MNFDLALADVELNPFHPGPAANFQAPGKRAIFAERRYAGLPCLAGTYQLGDRS